MLVYQSVCVCEILLIHQREIALIEDAFRTLAWNRVFRCTTASKWHWLKTFLAKTAVKLTVTPRSHHLHISFSIIDRGVFSAGCLLPTLENADEEKLFAPRLAQIRAGRGRAVERDSSVLRTHCRQRMLF